MSDTPHYPLLMGVLLAEDRAREQRILEERREQDARILAEDDRWQRRTQLAYKQPAVNAATCEHHEINAYQNRQDGDVETIWGACMACNAWVVSTLYLSSDRPVDVRPMTVPELEQFAKMEEMRRHEEWLGDEWVA